jgi:hypothetical protein
MPVGFCTAEGVGSNPIGSTLKSYSLQVKRKGSVETPELARVLVLQRVFQGAVCAVLHSALLARGQREKITAEQLAGAFAPLCSRQP